MTKKDTVYTRSRLLDPDHNVTYYGDNDNDPILVLTLTNERVLSWWERWLTGNKYSYTLTITDE